MYMTQQNMDPGGGSMENYVKFWFLINVRVVENEKWVIHFWLDKPPRANGQSGADAMKDENRNWIFAFLNIA